MAVKEKSAVKSGAGRPKVAPAQKINIEKPESIFSRHKYDFLAALFFVLGVWSLLGIYSNSLSVFGDFINTLSGMTLGVIRYGLPVIFFLTGILIAGSVARNYSKKINELNQTDEKQKNDKQKNDKQKNGNNKKSETLVEKTSANLTAASIVGGGFILISVLGMLHFTLGRPDFTSAPDEEFRAAGGILGAVVAIPFETLIGVTAASVVLIALGIVGISIATRSTFVIILKFVFSPFAWLFVKRPPAAGMPGMASDSNGQLPAGNSNSIDGFAPAPGIEKIDNPAKGRLQPASPSISLTEKIGNWRKRKQIGINTDLDPMLTAVSPQAIKTPPPPIIPSAPPSEASAEAPPPADEKPADENLEPASDEIPDDIQPAAVSPTAAPLKATLEEAGENKPLGNKPSENKPSRADEKEAAPIPGRIKENKPAPVLKTQKWVLPGLNLLNRGGKHEIKTQALKERGKILEQALAAHGVVTRVVGRVVGPTVTRYELELGEGIKVAKLTSLNKDIAYAMAAHDVRILAPIPGRQAIGIEVPNINRAVITLGDVLASKEAAASKHPLEVALGKDINGDTIILNVAETPHLLIAGATGAGKSSCLNSIVTSILMRSTPDQVRMILIDPKMVEMCQFEGSPHLLSAPVVDPKKAANALGWAAREMDRRYEVLFKAGYRDINGYNTAFMKGDLKKQEEIKEESSREEFEYMPYIVVVVDELADLMMVAARDVEDYICRLAQKARAVGIHLVIATQRPSTDVITGVIKANVPARLAFSVSSLTDSRVILDQAGAERLVGQGDMLLRQPTSGTLTRIQGAWITEQEVKNVAGFWSKQTPELNYISDLTAGTTSQNGVAGQRGDSGDDELLDMAMELVVNSGFGSTSMLQRKLRVGFARAGRLMDLLEEKGIVGPSEGSKPREVLVAAESVND